MADTIKLNGGEMQTVVNALTQYMKYLVERRDITAASDVTWQRAIEDEMERVKKLGDRLGDVR